MILTLISQLAGVAALITAIATALVMWRKLRSENRKTDAEADKAGAEGQVALSGTTLAWAERADARAEKAETKAGAAEKEAREANRRADECQRDRDNDRELIADLRRDHDRLQASYNQLLERIAACPAGHICPIADSLTR